jgi:hypothetical protein
VTCQQRATPVLAAVAQADFFKDLDKELNDWTQSKEKDGKPLGLWEELAGIGEELVDYLEDSLGIKEAEAAAKKASGSSSSSDRPKSAVDQYEELLRNLNMESKGTDGSKSSSSSGGSQQQANRWVLRAGCLLVMNALLHLYTFLHPVVFLTVCHQSRKHVSPAVQLCYVLQQRRGS